MDQMNQPIKTQEGIKANSSHKFGWRIILIILAVIVVIALLMIILSKQYLAWVPYFRTTNKTIVLLDNSNITTETKGILQKNNIQLDPDKEMVSGYEKIGGFYKTRVDISVKYQNIPIFSRTEHLYFDKNDKFQLESDNYGGSTSTITYYDENGKPIPTPKVNEGMKILESFRSQADYSADEFLQSIGSSLSSIQPTVSYQQAIDKALQNPDFASMKTAGYSAQLGILDKLEFVNGVQTIGQRKDYSGTLVWKIMANDKRPKCSESVLCYPLEMANYYVLIDGSSGKFICGNGRQNTFPNDFCD